MIEMPVASPEELRICTHTPCQCGSKCCAQSIELVPRHGLGMHFLSPPQQPKENKRFSKTSCSVRTYKNNTENWHTTQIVTKGSNTNTGFTQVSARTCKYTQQEANQV